ncbi:MAG: hypothetical protein RCO49_08710 [Rickettsia endosymbiont of Argas persicus]
MHPLSVAEVIENFNDLTKETRLPKKISAEQFESLFKFGGFPDPYLKGSLTFGTGGKKLKTLNFLRKILES